MGVDLAKYEDYTVITVLDATDSKFPVLVYFERFNKMPWQYVTERVIAVSRLFNGAKAFVDSTGVGDPIAERLEREIGAEGWNFGSKNPETMNNRKLDIINALSGFVSNHSIRFPNIQQLVNELKFFSYVKSKDSGRWKMLGVRGFNDDCVCSLGLACVGVMRHKPLMFFSGI
jgi:phage FluMu gp28-like protein